MDYLAIFGIVMRTLAIIVAVALAFVYFAAQFFQKLPTPAFGLKMHDYLLYFGVALFFSLGLNSPWGFLAFLPLLGWKAWARKLMAKNNVNGAGRWMEIRWQRLTPKGFSNIPKETWTQVSAELQRLPQDTHFLLPRMVTLWAIRFLMKKVAKQNLANTPQLRGREGEVTAMLNQMADAVIKLEKAKSKAFNLPFGVLNITRL